MNPQISVIMTVFNTAQYVREAIDSILSQTYSDFELIVINDGSSDGSREIIDSYADDRVKRIHNPVNLGASRASNIGLELARGRYVARMDSDDISLPDRLEKQFRYMEAHPETAVLGTWAEVMDGDRPTVWRYSNDPHLNRCRLLFNPCFAHSSIMMRRSILDRFQIRYNPHFTSAIDYELYSQFPPDAHFCNLQEALYIYRRHSAQMSARKREEQQSFADQVRKKMLDKLQIEPTLEQMQLHREISFNQLSGGMDALHPAHEWLVKLDAANEQIGAFPKEGFRKLLAEYWTGICNSLMHHGQCVWDCFFRSPFVPYITLPEQSVRLDQLAQSLERRDSRLAIFGVGRMGYFLGRELGNRGVEVKCYLDNYKAGSEIDGIAIHDLNWLQQHPETVDTILVTILGAHDMEIVTRLKAICPRWNVWSWKNFV